MRSPLTRGCGPATMQASSSARNSCRRETKLMARRNKSQYLQNWHERAPHRFAHGPHVLEGPDHRHLSLVEQRTELCVPAVVVSKFVGEDGPKLRNVQRAQQRQ